MELACARYHKLERADWNRFVKASKNGVFFFDRTYMEYHSDLFADFSAVIRRENVIIGVVPASIEPDMTVTSHGGLTFGGLVVDPSINTVLYLECFKTYLEFLRSSHVKRLVYKAVPSFYHQYPAAEELYAAFRFGGKLIRRDVGSVLHPSKNCDYHKLRKRMIRKGQANGLVVKETRELECYWEILSNVLKERHQVRPVHSLEEIQVLSEAFPENIRLFGAFQDGNMLAGVLVFVNPTVTHCQYIASTPEGRIVGALDVLFHELISQRFSDKEFFSFGISTEQGGTYLNEGLILYKEGFGARAAVSDFYEFIL
jgi:hypothetical protein